MDIHRISVDIRVMAPASSKNFGRKSADMQESTQEDKTKNTKSTISKVNLSTNNAFDAVSPPDNTVEICGYVDVYERPKTVGKDIQYKLVKFVLSNNSGRRVQCVAWEDQVERVNNIVGLNKIIHLNGAVAQRLKDPAYNIGTVPFELNIREHTEVEDHGFFEEANQENVESVAADWENVAEMDGQFIRKYVTTSTFRKGQKPWGKTNNTTVKRVLSKNSGRRVQCVARQNQIKRVNNIVGLNKIIHLNGAVDKSIKNPAYNIGTVPFELTIREHTEVEDHGFFEEANQENVEPVAADWENVAEMDGQFIRVDAGRHEKNTKSTISKVNLSTNNTFDAVSPPDNTVEICGYVDVYERPKTVGKDIQYKLVKFVLSNNSGRRVQCVAWEDQVERVNNIVGLNKIIHLNGAVAQRLKDPAYNIGTVPFELNIREHTEVEDHGFFEEANQENVESVAADWDNVAEMDGQFIRVDAGRHEKNTKSTISKVNLSTNNTFDAVSPPDNTVEICGYVDVYERPKTVGKDIQYKLVKFVLSNNSGRRVQCVAWEDQVERVNNIVGLNKIIHLNGAVAQRLKDPAYNIGTVPFELNIREHTEVEDHGFFEEANQENVESVAADWDNVAEMDGQFIRVDAGRHEKNTKSTISNVNLSTNNTFDAVSPPDNTVEICGYVDVYERPKTVGKDIQYKLVKFVLSNNSGRRVQCVAWEDQVERVNNIVGLNKIIHLNGAVAQRLKDPAYNIGTVPFELNIREHTEVEDHGFFEEANQENVESVAADWDNVAEMDGQFIRVDAGRHEKNTKSTISKVNLSTNHAFDTVSPPDNTVEICVYVDVSERPKTVGKDKQYNPAKCVLSKNSGRRVQSVARQNQIKPVNKIVGLNKGAAPAVEEPYPGSRNIIRKAFLIKGKPEESLDIAISSLTDSSLRQYETAYKKLWYFCLQRRLDFYKLSIPEILTFLTEIFQRGASYGTINSYRSAIAFIYGPEISQDDRVKKICRGIAKQRPQKPKYDVTWDPKVVLDNLSSWPKNTEISLEKLSMKLVILLALITGHRIQTLSVIDIQNISKTNEIIEIKIPAPIKTSGPGRKQPTLILTFYSANKDLCAASALEVYLDRTRKLRNNISTLFISFKRPHKAVTTQTLSRWIKSTLTQSGVDTSIFTAYSTRRARLF